MAAPISFSGANSGLQAGNIHGPVQAEFHQYLPPERAETPPAPSILIPFGRDDDFVERGTILDQLHDRCAVPGSRTALVGLGGVGKSQLAIEYAYRTRERSSDTWVFWVHASNVARFEQSYRDIANCVKIPGRHNPKINIFQLVHDWLWDKGKGSWMLILDNVDDARFLVENRGWVQEQQTNHTRPLPLYLPQCQHGRTLITTRSRDAALKLVELGNILTIDPMSEANAPTLLERKVRTHSSLDGAAELAAALEFMPLAIVQAAAYISERAPRCSVRQYLEQFQKSDRKRASLLDCEGGQLRRDVEAKNSIIITWQISFDRIREIRRTAADLLALMSFFDRQGIPELLLHRRQEVTSAPARDPDRAGSPHQNVTDDDDSNTDDERNTDSNDDLEDDISVLRSYSFITATGVGMGLEMHRLVQLAMQKWLEVHGQQEQWKKQFICNLNAGFPHGGYGTWDTCQHLFPHVKFTATKKPPAKDSLTEWTSLLNRAVLYCLCTGNSVDAEKMSAQSLKLRKQVLGADHPDTLTSMANLASTYWNQGRWKEAEELFVQVREIMTRHGQSGLDLPESRAMEGG
ncbi:uncharacterized protein PV06_11909 [Exophiala oligosperma]|uniref:NB-ARC domain-containing protein n=1 Tax=Exophiala oligosperma TaxID=215243 RepID=A0A0D2A5W2_9EURO|nr:uncharacterized protein PV06_11909 [Exophiala oligosperma]KIW35751.1 hypothetical protein PV06_11909 [Exophiala oligosperma]